MKTNGRFLFLFCREDDERYQSFRMEEDIYGVPWNFIFYEIVRKMYFNSSKHLFLHLYSYSLSFIILQHLFTSCYIFFKYNLIYC